MKSKLMFINKAVLFTVATSLLFSCSDAVYKHVKKVDVDKKQQEVLVNKGNNNVAQVLEEKTDNNVALTQNNTNTEISNNIENAKLETTTSNVANKANKNISFSSRSNNAASAVKFTKLQSHFVNKTIKKANKILENQKTPMSNLLLILLIALIILILLAILGIDLIWLLVVAILVVLLLFLLGML